MVRFGETWIAMERQTRTQTKDDEMNLCPRDNETVGEGPVVSNETLIMYKAIPQNC